MQNSPSQKATSLAASEGNRFAHGLSNCGGVKGGSRTEETEAGSHSGTNCCQHRSQRATERGERKRGKLKEGELLSSPLEQLHLSREEGEVSTEMLRVHLSCHLYSNCPLF